jgi:hypothetical protein
MVYLHNFLPAKGWKIYRKTANNVVFWVLLFVV